MRPLAAIALVMVLSSSAATARPATVAFTAVSGAGPANSHLTLGRSPTAAQINGGVPADALIHDFLVTTDADIMNIEDVELALSGPATLLQNALGSNVEPPSPVLEAFFPELGADSWLTTPGPTSTQDHSQPFPTHWRWYDVTNDGAVADFLFARIAVNNPGQFSFRGRIQVNGANGPEFFPFEFTSVPEPAALAVAGWSLVCLALRRRRLR